MWRLVREHDWARTPLGAMWGRELVQIYNAGYARLAGQKHPAALGQPLREFWSQLWAVNGPLFERAWHGETVNLENALYAFTLDGERVEERYYTSSYSPIHDADGAAEIAPPASTMVHVIR